jgi:hypothetical protein
MKVHWLGVLNKNMWFFNFVHIFTKKLLLQNKLYWVIIAKKLKSRAVLKSHRKNVKTMATSIHVKHKYMIVHSPNYQFVY